MSQHRFDIGCTSLGAVLVVFASDAVVHIALDDDSNTLNDHAFECYPHAVYGDLESSQQKTFQSILDFVDAPTDKFNLPIHVQGTTFQQQVWRALQHIPFGETRSYSDIAKSIGKPNAVRAVATACASNQLALIIPCHRVIGKNGGLAGYRWGIQRKQALIAREQSMLVEQH